MEKNLINEIKKIKKLMLIDEACTEEEAIKLLKDKDYTIYTKAEKKALSADCIDKPEIKSLDNYLKNVEKGLDYSINSTSANCYIVVRSNNKTSLAVNSNTPPKIEIKRKFLFYFWEDGVFTAIVRLSPTDKRNYNNWKGNNLPMELPNGDVIISYTYQGKYEIDSNNLTINDLFYKGFTKGNKQEDLQSPNIKVTSQNNNNLKDIDGITNVNEFKKISDLITKIGY